MLDIWLLFSYIWLFFSIIDCCFPIFDCCFPIFDCCFPIFDCCFPIFDCCFLYLTVVFPCYRELFQMTIQRKMFTCMKTEYAKYSVAKSFNRFVQYILKDGWHRVLTASLFHSTKNTFTFTPWHSFSHFISLILSVKWFELFLANVLSIMAQNIY